MPHSCRPPVARIIIYGLAAVTHLAAASPVTAQSNPAPRPSVATAMPGWSIPPGSVLKLRPHHGAEIQGRVMGQFGDTLVVHPSSGTAGPIAFTPDEIDTAWIRDGSHARQGILVGGVTGLLIKTLWAWDACGGPCAPSGLETGMTAALAGGGALLGLIIGGSIPRWHPLE